MQRIHLPAVNTRWRITALYVIFFLVASWLYFRSGTTATRTSVTIDECNYHDHNPEIKAAILYLLAPGREEILQESLDLLMKHFSLGVNYSYPVWIYLEKPLPNLKVLQICDRYPQQPIQFIIVEDFLHTPPGTNFTVNKTGYRIGYSHMIQFWWKRIFLREEIRSLTFFWRLDTDTMLNSTIPYDVFQLMAQRNISYGYAVVLYDTIEMTVGMLDFISNYSSNNGIVPRIPAMADTVLVDGKQLPHMFYNNFEVVQVSAFLREDTQRFINAVDQSHGIYHHRWGDATLRYQLVKLFFDPTSVHHFCDIGYIHQFYIPPICNHPTMN